MVRTTKMSSSPEGARSDRSAVVKRAATLAVGALFLFASAAFADNLLVDGDGAVPVTPNFLNMGRVCSTGSTTKQAAVAVQATNHPSGVDVFAPGSTVTFRPTASAMALSGTGGSIVLPANWATVANGTMSPAASVDVTLRGGVVGAQYNDWITYTAVGTNLAGQPLSRTTSLNVRAAFIACADTTAPALGLPSDISVAATGSSGAVVTFTVTATDTNPSNPVVTCSPPSGSTFPIGTIVVTCSATDAAGNTATGTFRVTVNDGSAPAVSVAVNPTVPNGENGWYSSPVAVTVTASDNVGVASVELTLDGRAAAYSGPVIVGDGVHSVAASASDAAGNRTTTATVSFEVDTTAPVVTIASGSTARVSSAAALSPSDLTCETADPLSGVATSAVLVITGGSENGVGTFTATCSGAKDMAGNVTEPVSMTFNLTYGTGSGILPPIAPNADRLLVRGKSVPVKFRLAGDESLRGGFDSSSWTVNGVEVECTSPATVLGTRALSSTSNHAGFRFSGDRYIFNADLRTLPRGTCWQIHVTLDDGQSLVSGTFRLTGKGKADQPTDAKAKGAHAGGNADKADTAKQHSTSSASSRGKGSAKP
jgi:hypothetical protein